MRLSAVAARVIEKTWLTTAARVVARTLAWAVAATVVGGMEGLVWMAEARVAAKSWVWVVVARAVVGRMWPSAAVVRMVVGRVPV